MSDTSSLEVGTSIKRQCTVSMRYLRDSSLLQYQANEQQLQNFFSPTPLQMVVYFTCFSIACHSSHLFPVFHIFLHKTSS